MNFTSASDPFYVAKDQFQKSLINLQDSVSRWELLYAGNTEKEKGFVHLHNKILEELNMLEKNLADFEQSIQVVEGNPSRFPHCTPYELSQRKSWISLVGTTIKTIGQKVNSPSVNIKLRSDKATYENELIEFELTKKKEEETAQLRLNETRTLHRQMISKQDEDLTELARTTTRLGNAAVAINNELQDQQRLLSELDNDLDKQREKLGYVMRKTGELFKTADKGQISTILALSTILFILFLINFLF